MSLLAYTHFRFLLAQIYLESLEDKITTKAVRRAIMQFNTLKTERSQGEKYELLDKVYDQTMERINRQKAGFQQLAIKVLSWITCAKRPLWTSELQHALAVDIGDSELDEENIVSPRRIVSVCAGLVTIDEEGDVIRFAHHTAQLTSNEHRPNGSPMQKLISLGHVSPTSHSLSLNRARVQQMKNSRNV
jgi:hypothetical protein